MSKIKDYFLEKVAWNIRMAFANPLGLLLYLVVLALSFSVIALIVLFALITSGFIHF